MTTPDKDEFMFPAIQELPARFREMAAHWERECDDESVRYQFRCSARGRQRAFEQAAQILEDRLNGV